MENNEANPPPNKIACSELDDKLNTTWSLDPDLAEYADIFIQNFTEYIYINRYRTYFR